jgi:hypothetical protein
LPKGWKFKELYVLFFVFYFDFVVVISNFSVIFIGVYVSFDVFARFDETC